MSCLDKIAQTNDIDILKNEINFFMTNIKRID